MRKWGFRDQPHPFRGDATMKHVGLRWIAVLPAAVVGVLVGRLIASTLSLAVDWPFSPPPRWVQSIDGWLVYLMCPACFITFGTLVAPAFRRAVSVVLAVAYIGIVVFAVTRLAAFKEITTFGWIGGLISLISCASTIAGSYSHEEPEV
jgi:hypothetical protein